VARAAGCSPAARRPARTTERDGKWLQDRIVRRLLLPGRRAVRRVRSTRRPGGTGGAAAPPAFAAPAAAAARCPLRWQKAAVCFWRRHSSHLAAMRGRPRPGIHTSQSEEFVRACVRKLRFCIASSHRFRKREPHTHTEHILFIGTHAVFREHSLNGMSRGHGTDFADFESRALVLRYRLC